MILTQIVFQVLSFSLPLLIHALPLSPSEPAIQRRVAYNVVAVDGSSGGDSGGNPSNKTPPPPAPLPTQAPSPTTVVQAVDQTKTVTISASTQPESTETIIATQIVKEEAEASTVTKSIIETSVPSSKPAIIIVNAQEAVVSQAVAASTTTPTSTASASRSSSTSSSSSVVSTSSPPGPTSSLSSAAATSSSSPVPSWVVASQWAQPSQPSVTSAAVQPNGQKYDDGTWHTSYPAWNSSSTAVPSIPDRSVR